MYQPAPVRWRGALAPQPASYNPVGFGFGGYSYGGYPAYGFNGYLPSVYAGFNTPGVAGPNAGRLQLLQRVGSSRPTCGPTGCRLNYRGWSPEAAISRPVAPQREESQLRLCKPTLINSQAYARPPRVKRGWRIRATGWLQLKKRFDKRPSQPIANTGLFQGS